MSTRTPPPIRQAWPAMVFHGLNILALVLMAASGLQIYNANPVFGGRAGWDIPVVFTLGGWLAGGRHWHFAVMWLYALNLLFYGLYIAWTRRWRIRFVSNKDFKALKTSRNPRLRVFAWHRLAYTGIIPFLLLGLLTGLGMYRPAQLAWIVDLFGNDWQTLRVVHLSTIPVVLAFSLVHSFLGFSAGGVRMIRSMFLP